jgi:hypothetical protein
MVNIQVNQQKIRISSPTYTWKWDTVTDLFLLLDSENCVISRARHQPHIITSHNFLNADRSFEIIDDRVAITYLAIKSASRLTVSWFFHPNCLSLEELQYKPAAEQDIIQIVYFPEIDDDSNKLSFYSHYAVVPGLSMCSSISPIVDLHSRLSTTTILG